MTTYAIGDVQGCCTELEKLLAIIDLQDPGARLLFAGDLVNRGPRSLDALRLIRSLGDRAICVLGNHDLHLLGMAQGIRQPKGGDTLKEILDAPDSAELIDWVRSRHLAWREDNWLMVHAGILPQWDADLTMACAKEVEAVLRAPNWGDFIANMYGNHPNQWSNDLKGFDRLRCIVNGLTRLRFCTPEGVMEYKAKLGVDQAPEGCLPWFDVPSRKTKEVDIIFGHWSTLGLCLQNHLYGLDTGCVWGGTLTAVRLSDKHVISVKAARQYNELY